MKLNKSSYYIKNPTVRKVKNRGWLPVTYHSEFGYTSGWIYKQGTKWLHFYSPTLGKKRLPKTAKLKNL